MMVGTDSDFEQRLGHFRSRRTWYIPPSIPENAGRRQTYVRTLLGFPRKSGRRNVRAPAQRLSATICPVYTTPSSAGGHRTERLPARPSSPSQARGASPVIVGFRKHYQKVHSVDHRVTGPLQLLRPDRGAPASRSVMPTSRGAAQAGDDLTDDQKAQLAAQHAAFDFEIAERAELLREHEALQALLMEQLKNEDEIMKKWIALI
jgi:hypothetical protein